MDFQKKTFYNISYKSDLKNQFLHEFFNNSLLWAPLLEAVQAKARPCPEEEARPTSAWGCAWHRMTLSTVWVFSNENFPFFQLMAKVEELNKSMAPAYKLAEQVKEVKRLLELLENVSNSKWRFVKCVELDVRSRDKSVGLEIKILLMCRTRIKDLSQTLKDGKRCVSSMLELEGCSKARDCVLCNTEIVVSVGAF